MDNDDDDNENTTIHRAHLSLVRTNPANETQPGGSLELIYEGHGMCSLDACIPIAIGEAIVALLSARVKAR